MQEFLSVFLPVFFLIYFGIAFVLKSDIVAKRIGKSPLVLPNDDSAYGLIGFYFRLTLILLFAYVLTIAFMPSLYTFFLPIIQLVIFSVQIAGICLLIIALIWTITAQVHMENSW